VNNVIKGNLHIPNFFWWIGVVESRADTEELGRYKVRIAGYHDPDTVKLPTMDLPWAIALQPVTSAGAFGIGQTPGLIEGSTVIGFFADGDDAQQPIIFGSFAAFSGDTPVDEIAGGAGTIGFRDLTGRFPPRDDSDVKYLTGQNPESDISRLARGVQAENHVSLKRKRDTRVKRIPRAILHETINKDISGSPYPSDRPSPTFYELRDGFPKDDGESYWNEPFPRHGETRKSQVQYSSNRKGAIGSRYPFNKVEESESGHIFEVDDTPGNERIHTFHTSGTCEEIQANGDKIVKVVGDNYEIVVGDDKVFIRGNSDVTVEGTVRLYILGDCIQEIEGSSFTTIKGDRVVAVEGNDILEVKGDQAILVEKNQNIRVDKTSSEVIGKDKVMTVGADLINTISNNCNWTIANEQTIMVSKDRTMIVQEDLVEMVSGKHKLGVSGESIHVIGSTHKLESSGNMDIKSNATVKVEGSTIDLNP